MARRSPRKKAISSETVVESQSDDEDFLAVASNDQYAASCPLFVITFSYFIFCSPDGKDVDDLQGANNDDGSNSHEDSNRNKKNTKPATRRSVLIKKDRSPTPAVDLEDDEDYM